MPGTKCFTNTWNNVDIPSWVGGNKAWVGFTAATGETSTRQLYIGSFSYTQGATTTQAATPTFSPAAGTYSGAQSVTISDATSGRNHLLHDQRNNADHVLDTVHWPDYGELDGNPAGDCGGHRRHQQRCRVRDLHHRGTHRFHANLLARRRDAIRRHSR